MLRSMRMKNFKSWADTGEIRLAPITGFYGANSSGKTSLLQMLLLMKQTSMSSDPRQVLFLGDDNSLVNLGTFYDIVHKHSTAKEIEVLLSWNAKGQRAVLIEHEDGYPDGELRPIFPDNLVFFSTTLGEEAGRILNKWAKFSLVGGEDYIQVIPEYVAGGIFWSHVTKGRVEEYPFYFDTDALDTRYWRIGALIKYPEEGEHAEEVVNFGRLFEQQLAVINYLGPLRDYPHRTYLWGGDQPSNVGVRGERFVAALLSARADNGQHSLELKVAEWLKKMELIHSFELRPIAKGRRDYEIVVKKTPESTEVLITDIGFGVSQLLPVLVLCYYVPEGSTLILEQPEIHLHPSVQADLADVFIDVIKTRNLQIIFESHSEYLLHRLQRRIAEEGLAQDQTALYFCHVEGEESKIEELKLDEYGNIANWPKDFFGDSTGDLVAMTEAEMRRKLAGG